MRKGSHLTEENKAKLRFKRTEEQKRNCSLAKMGNQYRKGCKNSPESNLKNSLTNKARLSGIDKSAWEQEEYSLEDIRRIISAKEYEAINERNNISGTGNPFYGKSHTEITKQKNRDAHLGTKMSVEARRKMSEAHKKNNVWLGRKHTDETKSKQSLIKMGSNNPVWNNGSSFYPYSLEWRRALKNSIRQRDNNICQLCQRDIDEIGVGWATHHIDYDKNNCGDEENLILLCKRCHGKTNHTNRKLWTSLFTTIIENSSPQTLDNN